jgi:hypothetical protein
VYAEHRQPRNMFASVVRVHLLVLVLVLFIGILSYQAFGENIRETVLFNLPQG